jgi:hypothetical protein
VIVDEVAEKHALAAQPAAQQLPTQDAYVQVLLRTEQMLNDAFDRLDATRKRHVLDEIERRRAARHFNAPGALRTLFPSLGMRRH